MFLKCVQHSGGGTSSDPYSDTITIGSKQSVTIPFNNPKAAYSAQGGTLQTSTYWCIAFRNSDDTLFKKVVGNSTDPTYVRYVDSMDDNGVTFYNNHSSSITFNIGIY